VDDGAGGVAVVVRRGCGRLRRGRPPRQQAHRPYEGHRYS
jgi:hypothetical protein